MDYIKGPHTINYREADPDKLREQLRQNLNRIHPTVWDKGS